MTKVPAIGEGLGLGEGVGDGLGVGLGEPKDDAAENTFILDVPVFENNAHELPITAKAVKISKITLSV